MKFVNQHPRLPLSPKCHFSVTYLDAVLSLSAIADSCLVNLEQVASNYRFVVPMSFVGVLYNLNVTLKSQFLIYYDSLPMKRSWRSKVINGLEKFLNNPLMADVIVRRS